MTTIAIDAMGGDNGVDTTVPAVLTVLEQHPDIKIILVGDKVILSNLVPPGLKNLSIHHASEMVQMDESAASALRGKKDSSMRVAINLVKDGVADAAVSAGNTGALMATSRFVLKMIKGIERPAICAALPTIRSHSWMLDLGANVNSNANHLLQFALMGNALLRAIDNNQTPTIGLLNVGEEEGKGNVFIQDAASKISASKLNYYGFVEGDDIYKGTVDMVVTDGFVGNVALKTSEGLAKMIEHSITSEFKRNWWNKLGALIAMPSLKAFKRRIDPRRYNGACLLGLNGVVVKSHGGTDALGFEHAILVAYGQSRHKLIDKIKQEMKKILIEEMA